MYLGRMDTESARIPIKIANARQVLLITFTMCNKYFIVLHGYTISSQKISCNRIWHRSVWFLVVIVDKNISSNASYAIWLSLCTQHTTHHHFSLDCVAGFQNHSCGTIETGYYHDILNLVISTTHPLFYSVRILILIGTSTYRYTYILYMTTF